MGVSYATAISIVELIFFVPGLVLNFYLCNYKHGWKSGGACWRALVFLSSLRIGGSICQIVSVTHISTGIFVAAIVLDLIGLSPLSLALAGLLQKCNQSMKAIPAWYFWSIYFCSFSGLATGIAGALTGIHGTGIDTTYTINGALTAAISLFIACFVLSFLALAYLWYRLSHPRESISSKQISHEPMSISTEKVILIATTVIAPMLLVRLIYSSIGDYGKSIRYSPIFGNLTLYVCLEALEEWAILIVCLVVGFSINPRVHNTR